MAFTSYFCVSPGIPTDATVCPSEKSSEVVLCAFIGNGLELHSVKSAEHLDCIDVLCAVVCFWEGDEISLSGPWNQFFESIELRWCRNQDTVWICHQVVDIFKTIYILGTIKFSLNDGVRGWTKYQKTVKNQRKILKNSRFLNFTPQITPRNKLLFKNDISRK